jgi:hypothetical protein
MGAIEYDFRQWCLIPTHFMRRCMFQWMLYLLFSFFVYRLGKPFEAEAPGRAGVFTQLQLHVSVEQ